MYTRSKPFSKFGYVFVEILDPSGGVVCTIRESESLKLLSHLNRQ